MEFPLTESMAAERDSGRRSKSLDSRLRGKDVPENNLFIENLFSTKDPSTASLSLGGVIPATNLSIGSVFPVKAGIQGRKLRFLSSGRVFPANGVAKTNRHIRSVFPAKAGIQCRKLISPSIITLLVRTLFLISMLITSAVVGENKFPSPSQQEKKIEQYKRELTKSPEKAQLWRRLGIVYFQLDRFDEAMEAFNKVALLDPSDGAGFVYRGMIHEQRGEISQAKNLYLSFLALNQGGKLTQEIRHRLRWLEDRELKEIVGTAVAREKQVNVSEIPAKTVAIVRFDAAALSPQLAALGRGIAELTYTDLSFVPELKLVERLELARLQQELALSQQEFSDKLTAPRIGKIVGAGKIITGKLAENAGHIEIDCGIIDVGPGLAQYPPRQEGKLTDVFALQKKLSLAIIEKLGYKITPEVRNRIDKPATESILALIAYSRGLDYADQGLYSLAEAEFKAAVSEDAGFAQAQQALDKYSGLSTYDGTIKPVKEIASMIEESTSGEEQTQLDRSDILRRLQNANFGIVPQEDAPYTTPQQTRGRVVVTGRFDR